ncbi:MAG: hypothetical protein ACPL6F_02815, partial [Anaerolineales bacterium]
KKAGYTFPAEGGQVRTKDGIPFSFELAYADAPGFAELAQQIADAWSKLGIQVTLKALPFDQLVSQYLEKHTFQAALVELNFARSPDPDPYPFWDQAMIGDGQNYSQWDDRAASEYLEKARVTSDWGERAKLYRNFQVRFMMEMPALPLFYPVYSYGVDDTIQNVRMGPLFDPADRFLTIQTWYLRARRLSTSPTETP